jgi:hypothetical protein
LIYQVSLTFQPGCKSMKKIRIIKWSSLPAGKPAAAVPPLLSENRFPKGTSAW